MENKFFGQNLLQLRKERHLSQSDLASHINVTTSAISKWENNKNMPDIEMLKTLSKFFEISLGELLGSSEYDFQQAIEPKTESEPIEPEPAVSDTESLSGKKISRPLLITAITILVLIMIAVAIGIYSRADQQPTMPFRVMNSRTVEDEVWGTTTEIGVYCKDKVNNYIMDLVSTYVETEWHEKGNYGGDAINTIIIYFYNDKSLAKDICPNADSYLFILNPEDISE